MNKTEQDIKDDTSEEVVEDLETEEVKGSNPEEQSEVDVDKLQGDFKNLQEDYDKVKNSYQRLLADFENHKRRSAGEILEEKTKGKEEVLIQILDIVDNFDRALTFDVQTEEFKSGIQMVHKMLGERLEVVGLKEVESEGELDPQIHQAVATGEEDTIEDNHILEVLQKGYYVEDRLIRPAMVKVNKKNN